MAFGDIGQSAGTGFDTGSSPSSSLSQSGSSFGSISKKSVNPFDLEDEDLLRRLLEAQDVKIPEKPEEKKGVVGRFFDLLLSGEQLTAGIISGIRNKQSLLTSVPEAFKTDSSPSKELGIKNKVGAFAVDVLLDPLTYLGFGVGSGVAKTGTKVAGKAVSKVGEELIAKTTAEGLAKGLSEEAASAAARKLVAGQIDKGAVDLLAKKGVTVGVPFLTESAVIPGASRVMDIIADGVAKPVRSVAAALEPTAVGGVISKLGELGTEVKTLATNIFGSVENRLLAQGAPMEVVESYSTALRKYKNTLNYDAVKAVKDISRTAADAYATDPAAATIIRRALEEGAIPSDKKLAAVADILRQENKRIFDLDSKALGYANGSDVVKIKTELGSLYKANRAKLRELKSATKIDSNAIKALNESQKELEGLMRQVKELGTIQMSESDVAGVMRRVVGDFTVGDPKMETQITFKSPVKSKDLDDIIKTIKSADHLSDEAVTKIISRTPSGYKQKVLDVVDAIDEGFSEEQALKSLGLNNDGLFKSFYKAIKDRSEKILDGSLVKNTAEQAVASQRKTFDLLDKAQSTTDFRKVVQTEKDKIASKIGQLAEDLKPLSGKKLAFERQNYLTHMLTPEARDFLEKKGGTTNFFSKSVGLKNSFLSNHRNIEGTIEELNAAFKEIPGAEKIDLFEADPFKAFAARKLSSVKTVATRNMFDELTREVGEAIPKGMDEMVVDGIKYVKPQVAGFGDFALPEVVARDLEKAQSIITNSQETKKLLNLYDKTISLWKRSVTGIWPAFHGRNIIGGLFNNTLADVNPARYLDSETILQAAKGGKKALEETTIDLGSRYGKRSAKEVLEQYYKQGGYDQIGFFDVAKTVEDEIQQITGTRPLIKKIFEDLPMNLMQSIEARLRLPLFIDTLKKGGDWKGAMDQVFRYHFDYNPGAMSQFEVSVIRRIFPFYRWMKGNVALQLGKIAEQPGKYKILSDVVKSFQSENPADTNLLPEYMQEGLNLRVKTSGDTSTYLRSLGLPVEDLFQFINADGAVRVLEKLMAKTSPLITVPLQIGFQRDFYRGKPLAESQWVYPYINKIPGLRDFLKVQDYGKLPDGTENYRADPERLMLVNGLAGRFYTTVGNIMTKEAKADGRFDLWSKILNGTFGAKLSTFNIKEEGAKRKKEDVRKLQDELANTPVGAAMTRTFIPKEKRAQASSLLQQ